MIRSMRSICCLLFVLLLSGQMAWASPTGLNNIPTTDFVPENILIYQNWTDFGLGMQPDTFYALKYGVSGLEGLEIGVDWKSNGEIHGHVAFQAKYTFDINQDMWKGVVGIANVSDSRKDQGEVFPYLATSFDLEIFRLHAGFSAEPHNEAFFAGIDHTFPWHNRNLQLKADVIQINDMNDALFSLGFLYNLAPLNNEPTRSGFMGILQKWTKNIILEGWVSIPTASDEEVYTLKMNYVIEL